MDPHEHLRAQVAPPGSSLYYSLLFAAPRNRRPLCAVAAWQQEARRLAFAPRARTAALARVDWWAGEVRRLAAGSPCHPITRALADTAAPSCALGESVHRMLETVRRFVVHERVLHEEELWQHCDALGTQGEGMLAEVLAPPQRGVAGTLVELGRGLEMTELTRPLPGHALISPRMVPLAHGEALSGRAEGGDPGRCNAAMRDLLRGRSQRAEHLLRAALGRLAELPVPPERSRAAQAELALAHLGALARNRYRRCDTRLPPLRRLWAAWRGARRCP